MAAKLRDRDWNVLLESIEQGRCIPQLGPDLCTVDAQGTPRNLAVSLAHELAAILDEEKHTRIEDQNNLRLVAQMFQNELTRDELNVEVGNFYRAYQEQLPDLPEATFDHLAALPFPLYMTLRHDDALRFWLDKKGRPPRVEKYDFQGGKSGNLSNLGTNKEPLVYQLYGSSDDARSMVLTENDLIDFLVAVVSENPGLPKDLTNLFKERSFLFLGFGLSNYYLRILFHVLGLNQSGSRSFALEYAPVPDVQELFEQGFKDSVLFYDKLGYNSLKLLDVNLEEFIQELRERWDKRHPEVGWDMTPDKTAQEKPEAQGPSVFISYVQEDEERARRMFERLREERLNPWLDQEGLRFGDQWEHMLEDTISKDVDYFLLLQSRELIERRETFVNTEVELALKRQTKRGGGFVYPVEIDADIEPLDAIRRAKIQSWPIDDWNSDIKELASTIKRDYARLQKKR